MKIILFEGIDASGKETQVKLLKESLEDRGYVVKTESFPRYNTPIGKLIKDILIGKEDISTYALHLLYEVDRLDFQKNIEEYRKEKVDFLLLDRYTLSNLVYMQAREIDTRYLESVITEIEVPDFIVVLNISTETSVCRRVDREDLFEKDLQFLEKASDSYRTLSRYNLMGIDSDNLNPNMINIEVLCNLKTMNLI